VAREVARKLGFVYVNSGAMYRAFTWFVLENGLNGNDRDGIVSLVQNAKIRSSIVGLASRFIINDTDPTEHLRDARVNSQVSQVSAIP
jgi:cytidylate kinase